MKNILLIGTGLFFTVAFMMNSDLLHNKAVMIPCKSLWNKMCQNSDATKNFLINNKTKSIVVTAASAGAGYGVHLGIQQLNYRDEGKVYFEKIKDYSKEIAIGLSTLGGLLGFGGLIWSNGQTNAFLEQINHVKKLRITAEDEKARLLKTNKQNYCDVELMILNQSIIKQECYIDILNKMLIDLEEKLQIIRL